MIKAFFTLIMILVSVKSFAEIYVIKPGDTLSGFLSEDFTGDEIVSLAKELKSQVPGFVLRPGMEVDFSDDMISLMVSNDLEATFYREEGIARLMITRYDYKLMPTMITGVINTSLYQSILDSGEDPELAASIARIFEWEFDFFKDFRKGDTFKILVEKRFIRNRYVGYGKVLAAEFNVNSKNFKAYRLAFNDKVGYFNEDGRPLERGFLRVPLSYTRISSVFTDSRLHPITKKRKPHYGIDYAAPTGTPVMVTATGTVTKRTYNKASGNYIEVSHANGYKTYYLHLSKFSSHIGVGSKVEQGQVIGYVGSTGYSTGPHLDYRINKNGRWLNPQNFVAEVPKLDERAKYALIDVVNKYDNMFNCTRYVSISKRSLLPDL